MFKRIILGAFTFWVGLTATVTLPNASVGAKLTLVERVAAEAPTDECASLVNIIVSTKKRASSAASVFRQRLTGGTEDAAEQIEEAVFGTVNSDDFPVDTITNHDQVEAVALGIVKTSVTNQLRDIKDNRIINSVNSDLDSAYRAYFESVKQLGLAGCPQYAQEVSDYNLLATNFNSLAKTTFPQNPTTLTTLVLGRLDERNFGSGTAGARHEKLAIQGVTEAIPEFAQVEGKLNLASVELLPTDPKQIDPDAQSRANDGNKSTKPVDPNVNRLGDLATQNDPCGCAAATDTSKSTSTNIFDFAGKVFWDTLALFCGLGCLALSSMVQLYLKAYVLADCVRLGFPATIPECNFFGPPTTTTPDTSGSVDTGDIVPPPDGTSETDSIINESGAVGTSPEDLNNQELTNDVIFVKP